MRLRSRRVRARQVGDRWCSEGPATEAVQDALGDRFAVETLLAEQPGSVALLDEFITEPED